MTDKINKIISETNLHWKKDEIIRYLYVKLAPYFERDLEYFFADEIKQLKMYKEGFKKNTNLVVCKTLSEIYKSIYDDFNIKSKIITTNKKQIPHYTLIVNGDFGWYCIDPLKDLVANQLGLRTHFFGLIPENNYSTVKEEYPFLIRLTKGYVEDLDEKLHLTQNNIYMDDFFEILHLEMTNNHIYKYFNIEKKDTFGIMLQKLKFAEKYLIDLGKIPGLYERKFLYGYIIDCIYNRNEKKFIESKIIFDDSEYKLIINLYSKLNSHFTFEESINEKGKHYLKRIK